MLTRYALERLLYRLGASKYAEQFLLKGALLFDLWFDVPLRPTRDIDLLGFGAAEIPHVIGIFRDLCRIETEDGMSFAQDSVEATEIRKEAHYAGIRISMLGLLGRSKTAVQVDIGYGDAVTPAPEAATYPVLLPEFPGPQLRVYPRYTVVAEKVETLVTLGIANSRMKDYFDLWILHRQGELDPATLQASLVATFGRRGRPLPQDMPVGLSDDFAADPQKQRQWATFLKKNRLDALQLIEVIRALRAWLEPLLMDARHGA